MRFLTQDQKDALQGITTICCLLFWLVIVPVMLLITVCLPIYIILNSIGSSLSAPLTGGEVLLGFIIYNLFKSNKGDM